MEYAMSQNEFWKLISLINHEALEECDDEEAVEPIVSVLSSKTEEEISEFQESLSQALYAIDGQKWIQESGESSGSGDGFLYARCYVVAKGYDHYSKVLSNPSLMPKSSEQWAESILYVAGQAWAELTGNDEEDYDREATVSYESFSNVALW
ncbi:hypothetical protein CWN99_04765 [Vibrio splendidus]|nr:hypothetical protein CWN99_04765 [Vibrio splendidus]